MRRAQEFDDPLVGVLPVLGSELERGEADEISASLCEEKSNRGTVLLPIIGPNALDPIRSIEHPGRTSGQHHSLVALSERRKLGWRSDQTHANGQVRYSDLVVS